MKKLDLTGQRFGELTVLRPAENLGGQTAWVCRCDCGRESIVRTGNLRSGGTKSCGCLRAWNRQELTLVSEQTLRQRLDLTGQRFGKLTVLRPAENIGRHTAWVCLCDCGQNTVVRTSSLRDGEVSTCGCRNGTRDPLNLTYLGSTCEEQRILRKRLDLTGQRFGLLTVLHPAENIGKRTAWECRCDCGRETVVMTGNLRSGGTRSCGCQVPWDWGDRTLVSESVAYKRLDLTGQRYGHLTVLRPAENIGKHTAWICRCDCGQETVVKTTCLRTGHTKSCGNRCAFAVTRRGAVPQKNNTSGVTGVEWLPREHRWKASIAFLGKRYYLGAYDEFEDAVGARKRAEADLYDRSPDERTGSQDQIING